MDNKAKFAWTVKCGYSIICIYTHLLDNKNGLIIYNIFLLRVCKLLSTFAVNKSVKIVNSTLVCTSILLANLWRTAENNHRNIRRILSADKTHLHCDSMAKHLVFDINCR